MTVEITIKLSRGDKAILAALKPAGSVTQDAYALSKQIGLSPMAIGQAMSRMEAAGLMHSSDPTGTANDLARHFIRC